MARISRELTAMVPKYLHRVVVPILEHLLNLLDRPDEFGLSNIEGFMMIQNLLKNSWKRRSDDMRRKYFAAQQVAAFHSVVQPCRPL